MSFRSQHNRDRVNLWNQNYPLPTHESSKGVKFDDMGMVRPFNAHSPANQLGQSDSQPLSEYGPHTPAHNIRPAGPQDTSLWLCSARAVDYLLRFVRGGAPPPLKQAMHMYFYIPVVPMQAAVYACLRETHQRIVAGFVPVEFNESQKKVLTHSTSIEGEDRNDVKHLRRIYQALANYAMANDCPVKLSEPAEDQVLRQFLLNTRMSQRMTTLWIILDNLLNTHRGAIPYDDFATKCMERLTHDAGQLSQEFDHQMVSKLLSMLLFWHVIHSHPKPEEYMNTCMKALLVAWPQEDFGAFLEETVKAKVATLDQPEEWLRHWLGQVRRDLQYREGWPLACAQLLETTLSKMLSKH